MLHWKPSPVLAVLCDLYINFPVKKYFVENFHQNGEKILCLSIKNLIY